MPRIRAAANKRLAWVDKLLGLRPFVAGDQFSIADITLYVTIDFGGLVGEKYDPSLKNRAAFHEKVKALPSASA